jgi:hypothetical protein
MTNPSISDFGFRIEFNIKDLVNEKGLNFEFKDIYHFD